MNPTDDSNATAQLMRIGPLRKDWHGEEPKGLCLDCGGQCAPECGRHPAGCFFGGFSEQSSYWMIAEGCPLYHGDPPAAEPAPKS